MSIFRAVSEPIRENTPHRMPWLEFLADAPVSEHPEMAPHGPEQAGMPDIPTNLGVTGATCGTALEPRTPSPRMHLRGPAQEIEQGP